MTFVMTPYAIVSAITAGVALIVAFAAWRRRHVVGGASLAGLMVAVGIWSAGAALEYATVEISGKVFWAKLEYIGVLTGPVVYLLFAVFGAARSEVLPQWVDAMAPLEPELVESDYTAMVSEISRRVRRRSLIVVLTDLNSSALEEGLLQVLPQLSARHQVIIAAVSDPRVDELAAARTDPAAVYDAAAAERARNDRRDLAARLRRCGVEVVDAAPEDLAPGLADRYLAMKAAGRL